MDNPRIVVLGGRGSIPVSGPAYVRYGGDTTSFAMMDGSGAVAFVDAGTGLASYRTHGIDLLRSVDVFLSHYHWDHIQGLTMLEELWKGACDVRVWGVEDAASILVRAISPPLFPVSIADDATLSYSVLEGPYAIGDYRISSFPVHHPQGAMGFRIDGPNRSLGIVTDHEAGSALDAGIAAALVGVEVLIHDAQYLPEEMETHEGWGHSTFEDAIALGEEIGAVEILLTSHDPTRTDDDVDAMLVRARMRNPTVRAVHQGLEVPL